jgi:hypothetical protein
MAPKEKTERTPMAHHIHKLHLAVEFGLLEMAFDLIDLKGALCVTAPILFMALVTFALTRGEGWRDNPAMLEEEE